MLMHKSKKNELIIDDYTTMTKEYFELRRAKEAQQTQQLTRNDVRYAPTRVV